MLLAQNKNCAAYFFSRHVSNKAKIIVTDIDIINELLALTFKVSSQKRLNIAIVKKNIAIKTTGI